MSRTPTLATASAALPPEGAQSALGRPGGGFKLQPRTRIKVCGLTREEDVDICIEAGVDALGFNLYPKSPRYITPRRASELARRMPAFMTPVLLFVNELPATIAAARALVGGAMLQFHGDESPEFCGYVTDSGLHTYIKAARIPLDADAPRFDLVQFAQNFSSAQAILLDAHVDGFGGSGKVFNWSLLPPNVDAHLVLSGGLTPANVGEGIACVRPRARTLAVDVSSGVEALGADGKPIKGIKDPAKIFQFVAAVRAADAQASRV